MKGKRFSGDIPGTYRICIEGRLHPEWSARLGGMAISVRQATGKPAVTTLRGELIDQAALMGVLNTLYDLGFTLLKVEMQSSKSATGST